MIEEEGASKNGKVRRMKERISNSTHSLRVIAPKCVVKRLQKNKLANLLVLKITNHRMSFPKCVHLVSESPSKCMHIVFDNNGSLPYSLCSWYTNEIHTLLCSLCTMKANHVSLSTHLSNHVDCSWVRVEDTSKPTICKKQ